MKNTLLILLILSPFLCKSQNATLNKYFDAGIPILDKMWLPQDYVNAINVLNSLPKDGNLALPSTKNESKDIFFKISSFENYWFLDSESIGIQEKVLSLTDIQKPLMRLYLKYMLDSKETNGVFNNSNEITSLQAVIVKFTDKQIEFTEKFLVGNPNLTKIQQDGLKKMTSGLNTFVSASFTIIKDEYIYYHEADICRVSKVFFDFYKKNRHFFEEASRKEFDKNIKVISDTHKLACVKNFAKL